MLKAWVALSLVIAGTAWAQEGQPPAEPEYEIVPIVYKQVVDINEGRLTLGAGLDDGYSVGKSVRIFRPLAYPDLNNPEATHELLAIVRIDRAQEDFSYATLGRGEVAAVGDLIDLTVERPTANLATPPRSIYRYRAGVSVRSIVGGTDGFAVLLGGFLNYRLPSSNFFALNASVDPLSLGLGLPLAARLTGTASFSATFWEVFAGLGAMPGLIGGSPLVTFNFGGRIGSLDGISATLGTGLALAGFYTSFVPVLFTADLGMAFTREVSGFANLTASATYESSATVGARYFTQGGGEAGTIIYSVGLGGSLVQLEGGATGGIHVTAGAEFRF